MNILDKIAINKRLEIELLKVELPVGRLKSKIEPGEAFRFSTALSKIDEINIIAEIKKGSPSKGIISEDFDPQTQAGIYKKGGAAALSVLSESKYFYGHYDYLKIASDISGLPILCKDFMIDPYQLYYASYKQADAVLLIVRLLNIEQLRNMLDIAESLGLDAIVEVHNQNEIETALEAGAKIIGVNNRNLETFEVSLQNSVELSKYVPEIIIKISESGIFTPDDIKLLKDAGYNNFLIGEALMRSGNPDETIKALKSV